MPAVAGEVGKTCSRPLRRLRSARNGPGEPSAQKLIRCPEMTSLSIIVPATDAPATLPRCLAAIDRAGCADEVIVVDGPAHLSAAAARNAGAERARGDIVVFVDADVEVHADAFLRIRAAFETQPALTAVFGAYDDAPAADGVVSAFRNLLHYHVHHQAAGRAETFWSGLGAVRRTAFRAVGGFDEKRFPLPSVEDIDLGARLTAGGAHVVLDPTIQGTHLKRWTLRSMVVTDVFLRGAPWVALILRSGRGSTALNLGWRHRVTAGACAVGALALLTRRPVTAAAAVGIVTSLNHDLYALLARRRGVPEAVAGVALHMVHHLCGVVSVPLGVLSHLRDRGAGR
jgi:hypothetical protein